MCLQGPDNMFTPVLSYPINCTGSEPTLWNCARQQQQDEPEVIFNGNPYDNSGARPLYGHDSDVVVRCAPRAGPDGEQVHSTKFYTYFRW